MKKLYILTLLSLFSQLYSISDYSSEFQDSQEFIDNNDDQDSEEFIDNNDEDKIDYIEE